MSRQKLSIEQLAKICSVCGNDTGKTIVAIKKYTLQILEEINEESKIYARSGKGIRQIADYVFDKYLN